MITPRWWSQPFPPTGAITSEGIRNQLGRPPVDPLTVFVRETAQNSWDARLPDSPTTYRLELTSVAPVHRPTWERLLTPPAAVEEHLRLGRVVRTPNLRLLSVVDRGTKGLGGPTRADELATDRKDWVSFVLNVGEKRDTTHGGGTYGYGKAVLYRLSTVGTVIVYTRTRERDGQLSSRLIGIALGESFDSRERVDAESRPFTGRHWWGDVQDDHVEPIVGIEADAVARSLGLRPFEDGESGTTLTVLDPDLGDFEDDVDRTAQHLANTIAWQLWPIMLPERGRDRLVPEVNAGGRSFLVPSPEETYPLNLFVAAFRSQRDGHGTVLECHRPRRALGRFAVHEEFVIPMAPDSANLAAEYAGVPGDPHHVCLMRSPELVVRYLPEVEPASPNRTYAAVFRAFDELDEVYAQSEPPTHDNWVHEQLTGSEQTFVRTTFRRIREQLIGYRTTALTATPNGNGAALGAASSFLGGIVAAVFAGPDAPVGGSTSGPPAAGAGGFGGSGAGGGSRPSPAPRDRVRASLASEPVVEERAGRVVLVQRVSVVGVGRALLEARLSIGLGERAREDDAPAASEQPRVLMWSTPSGEQLSETCPVEGPAEVDLVVLPATDTVTDIAVTVSPGQQASS